MGHIVGTDTLTMNMLGEQKTAAFNSTIVGTPAEVALKCVYGRDGVDDSDWTETIDSSEDDCKIFKHTLNLHAVNLQHPEERAVAVGHVLIFAVGMLCFITLWALSRIASKSKVLAATETEPLLDVIRE